MLNINIQATRDAIQALDMSQLLYMLVEVRPPDDFLNQRLPLNLCLIIDRSTSMRGERLEKVKAAATLVIEKLSERDTLSVITYSDRAEIVFSSTRVEKKRKLIGDIKGILASGATEIYPALRAGLNELRKAHLGSHINHIILLTDGHTYGDAEKCLELASEAASKQIGFSAFGIGTDWNDQFLDALVSPSGGQSSYIESSDQIVAYLQQKIQGLGAIYAQNLSLETKVPKGISLKYGLKLTPHAQPLPIKSRKIKLGNVEGHEEITALLEYVIEPQLAGRTIKIPLDFRVDIPTKQVRNQLFSHEHELKITATPVQATPPKALMDAVNVLSMYRMNEQVWQDVEAGKIEQATKRLQYLTNRLMQVGETNLAHQAYLETERLNTMGSLSEEGRKKLKFGTRSLMTKGLNIKYND